MATAPTRAAAELRAKGKARRNRRARFPFPEIRYFTTSMDSSHFSWGSKPRSSATVAAMFESP